MLPAVMKRGESLRDELDRRQAAGGYFTLPEAVATMVPLVLSLADHHDEGVPVFVHPSSIVFRPTGSTLDLLAGSEPPTLENDLACLAPEERDVPTGGAGASVFACGAILYEMVTGQAVGEDMQRPSELAPEIPEAFELLLGKALVTDPSARPRDLRALAQALHRAAPAASLPPPEADDDGFDVDLEVSLSMIPSAPATEDGKRVAQRVAKAKAAPAPVPVEAASAPAPTPPVEAQPPSPRSASVSGGRGPRGATERLAELKARLEAEPNPRYVVIKDGLDHGPFSAVELLHQIAIRNFLGEHVLLDSETKSERPIAEWDEFAPFAQQAQKSVDAAEERKQLAAAVTADTERARVKTFAIAGVAFVGLAALAGLYFRFGKRTSDEVVIRTGSAQNVDFDGGIARGKGGNKAGVQAGPGVRANGGASEAGVESASDTPREGGGAIHPVVPDGLSCEGARSRYIEDYSKDAPPDLSAGAFGAVLNRGDYLNSCGVPPTMSVNVCAAVQNGHAVGVTVSTNPVNGGIARCISGQVRSLSFPSHPRLDITNTVFAAQ